VDANNIADDDSGDLLALYVHDDRKGPYNRAELDRASPDQLALNILKRSHDPPTSEPERWVVDHVLIPFHPKIRINFSDLFYCLHQYLIPRLMWILDEMHSLIPQDLVRVRYFIRKGHAYATELVRERLLDAKCFREMAEQLATPRYLAVFRLSSRSWGSIDILLDTTSAKTQLQWLGVVLTGVPPVPPAEGLREAIALYFAESELTCPLYGGRH
jgi:hypothetical protein